MQITGNGYRDAIAGLQTFGHFKALAALVFCLARRADLVLGNAIAVQKKNFVDAVAVIHCAFRKKNGPSFSLGMEACTKKPGFRRPSPLARSASASKVRESCATAGLMRETRP